MIRLIQLMIFGHVHKWETFDQVNLIVKHEFGGVETGVRFFCRCETCGKVIKRDLA